MNNELHSPTNDAIKKLEDAKAKANKGDTLAQAVLDQMIKRAGESEALASDIMQEHKTWDKCRKYIFEKARSKATNNGGGNSACVEDHIVYEWAEDYFHKDDKAEEEAAAKKKAAEDARRKKQNEARQASAPKAGTAAKAEKKETKPEPPAPKPEPKKELDGQMDLFSMLGI